MKRGIITIETNHIRGTLSSEGTIQMTTEEIASLFNVTVACIERHIKKIFAGKMLYECEVRTKHVDMFGSKRCIIEYYNLDMIIALSFQIDTYSSKVFRKCIGKQILQSLKMKSLPPIILQIPIHTGEAN
ncbi:MULTISPECIES: lipofamily protein [Bacteroidales]|uniref:lipofamily protein n=1 Tax=Bacteroidales TaxID=171549 RepID=UPI00256FD7F6|nr:MULTISPECIES: lipofamily protein [Bacteroidales]